MSTVYDISTLAAEIPPSELCSLSLAGMAASAYVPCSTSTSTVDVLMFISPSLKNKQGHLLSREQIISAHFAERSMQAVLSQWQVKSPFASRADDISMLRGEMQYAPCTFSVASNVTFSIRKIVMVAQCAERYSM